MSRTHTHTTRTLADMPTTRRQFHAIGRQTYGAQWDAHRAAALATLGLSSSNDLTADQAQAVLDNRVRAADLMSLDQFNALMFG